MLCARRTFGRAGDPLISAARSRSTSRISLVARQRFVAKSFSNKLWGLPLYFGAQLLLAASVAALTCLRDARRARVPASRRSAPTRRWLRPRSPRSCPSRRSGMKAGSDRRRSAQRERRGPAPSRPDRADARADPLCRSRHSMRAPARS